MALRNSGLDSPWPIGREILITRRRITVLKRINRPSPALVISVVALFVALGGTGYAAIQLPKASVGAKHLKKNSVSSAKVKDRSLLLADFKRAERTKLQGDAGARGGQGLRGVTGLAGVAGLRGGQGTAGVQGIDGSDGSNGLPGTDGLDGAQGIQGPDGPTGVEQVLVRTTSLVFPGGSGGDGQVLTGNVQCQAGESVVGGGTEIFPIVAVNSQPNTLVLDSRPADGAGTSPAGGTEPRGWFAAVRRNSQVSAQAASIYVLCASAAP